MTIIKNTKQV